jgi:short-subunit dehydrogenase
LTGASGGLGRAIAGALSTAGADELDAVAGRISADVLVADLATTAGLGLVEEACHGVDVLICNAGVDSAGPVEIDTATEVDRVLQVNLTAPIRLATMFARSHIDAHRPGQIILIGSLAGLVTTPHHRLYQASKFGLRGYGLGLRQDLATHGVGVSMVVPGIVSGAGMSAASAQRSPRWVRHNTPEDVARGVVRAIATNPVELFVAPVELRVLARLSAALPALSARAGQRAGAVRR